MVAVLSMLDTTTKLAARDQERPAAINEARTGSLNDGSELRQAYEVVSATSSRMEVLVRLNGVDTDVSYQCDAPAADATLRRCYRLAAPNGQPLPALAQGKVVVDRLANGTAADPVFCPSTQTRTSAWRPIRPPVPRPTTA